MGRVGASFQVARFVNDQDSIGIGHGRWRLFQQLAAPGIHRCFVPIRFRQEPLQALGPRFVGPIAGRRVGQPGQRLVALGRQQQTFQVAPEAFALVPFREQRVEDLGKRFEPAGGGPGYASLGHRAPPLPGLPQLFSRVNKLPVALARGSD